MIINYRSMTSQGLFNSNNKRCYQNKSRDLFRTTMIIAH